MPGQRVGENMKEQLALMKQPRARPALLSPRRVAGWEKRIEADMVPMARVPRMTVPMDTGGAAERMMEARTLTIAMKTPAKSVRLISPAEQVSGEAAESRKVPDIVREVGDVILDPEVEDTPARSGSGGWSSSTDTPRAKYPMIRSPREVRMVSPSSSLMKLRMITPVVATFDDHTCFNSCNAKLVFQSVQVRFAATAIRRTRPVRIPPSSIEA